MTVTDTSFQMANLVQEVVDGMQQALLPTDADENEAEEFLHKANVAADASMQQLVLMQQMLQMMQAMKHQMNIAPTSSDATARNRSFPTRTRTTIDKYCWSHGACAHHSATCRSKKPGHQDDATFQNKKRW